MTERLPKILKIATFYENFTFGRNIIIKNHDGTPMQHLFQAQMIILLAQGLGVAFNIVIPEDNRFGALEPHGKSTGMKGMLERGEVDMSVSGFTINEKRLKVFSFTYPILVTDSTFMTNSLEQHPKSFAIFEVFSSEVWLSIGMCIILISIILYFLLKRREKFSTILFESIGCLLENSFSFNARQKNTTLLLFHWFIGIAILIASYKAVILSIMTAPKMVGIRDKSDLAKAIKENSVKCFTWAGDWYSTGDNSKIFVECANKTKSEGLYGFEAFHIYPYKKAFLAERVEIIMYHKYYYVSDDSFAISFIGIPYSRNFCCPRKLEKVVHRISAAGLYEKAIKDPNFYAKTSLPKILGITDDNTGVLPLKLKDLTGAFLVLVIGHLCSFVVLIAEIVHKKWH